MTLPSPYVSIVMTSYNYASYIDIAIESVIRQKYSNWELLIVEDGSTDNSLEIIEKFAKKDSRIKVLQHKDSKNLGIRKSIELGISKSRGTWIAFLESDDVWSTDCLSKRLEMTQDYPMAEFIFNSIQPIQMEGADITWVTSYVARIMKRVALMSPPADLSVDILYENLVPTFSSAMVKSSLLKTCSFDTSIPEWLDWFLWSQVLQKTRAVLINEPLTYWRIHRKSLNRKKSLLPYLIQTTKYRQCQRKVLLPIFQSSYDEVKKRIINKPNIYFLFRRFRIITAEDGFRAAINKIIARLKS